MSLPQNDLAPACPPSEALARTIRVWDLPVRLFHWSLVALLVTAVVTGKTGGNAMETHLWAGYGTVVLVVFRFLWGWVGTPYARFSHFVRGVPSVLAYGRELLWGRHTARPGHNPLGGWMVVVLLAALAFQAGTGLFANDDIVTEGPLVDLVGKDMSDYLSALHKLNFKILLALAGIHVLAVALYRVVKGINLVRPMITGRMAVADPSVPELPMPGYANFLALALLAAIAAGFYALVL
ncbi:MAG TPA: cytochrome b/b6 domain-containing protein [Rhodocyclaceae bacterium]|nr:cytochrome b/b6 domain-containing protein [Rhodocyclaceae bacterium]